MKPYLPNAILAILFLAVGEYKWAAVNGAISLFFYLLSRD